MINKIFFAVSVSFFMVFINSVILSQGCSDAGACSIVGYYASRDSTKTSFKFSIEESLGLGEKFVFISQSTIELQTNFQTNTSVSFRIPFIAVLGNIGNNSGIGDGIISFRQQIYRQKKFTSSLLTAVRLRSNNADFSINGKPLPMAYQTSLGTYDVILGLLFNIKQWNFYTAFQHSFGRNKNRYIRDILNTNPEKDYYESAQLKRGNDLVFRVQRAVKLKNGNLFLFTLMPIYRMQNDEIIKNNENIKLAGSKELTLNINATYRVIMANSAVIEWLIGFPIIDREYRADGLTRNFVFTIRYHPYF